MKEEEVVEVLSNEVGFGLSITDLVKRMNGSRSAVRIILAKLEGAGKVKVRKVGMAKIYFLGRKSQ